MHSEGVAAIFVARWGRSPHQSRLWNCCGERRGALGGEATGWNQLWPGKSDASRALCQANFQSCVKAH
jgi:hypothetical protein